MVWYSVSFNPVALAMLAFSYNLLSNWIHFSSAVSDVLLDATDVLGGDPTLKILFTKLIQVNLAFDLFLL